MPFEHSKFSNGTLQNIELELYLCLQYTRETREGWPLLTVETKVNGDSKSRNERTPSLAG